MTTRRRILLGAATIAGFPAITGAQTQRTLKFSHKIGRAHV